MERLIKGKQAYSKPILKKNHSPQMLRKLALAIVITLVAVMLYLVSYSHTQEAKTKKQLEHTTSQLEQKKKEVEKAQIEGRAQTEQSKKQIEELNKQLEDTKKQLEAKRNTPKVYAAVLPDPVKVSNPGCVDAKSCIYSHESGNNPSAVNAGGCRGLGQACPGTKLPCGSDYACQDSWFTNYMLGRYGTWEKAWSFWQAQCATPQGCWW